jgi:imidazolonepropionase-like amidohydrolase
MSRLKTAVLAALLCGVAAPALAETVAITNARILTGTGEIPNGTVVIRDRAIAAVGANVSAPAGARVIDARGGVVTPGLIVSGAQIGLTEVSSLPETNDFQAGSREVSAAFDVQYGLNPASIVIPVARLGGVTRAVVIPVPSGGNSGGHAHDDSFAGSDTVENQDRQSLFAGQAAVVHLGQGVDMLTKAKVAMVAPLGATGANVVGGARGAEFVALKAIFDDVRYYARNRAAYERGDGRELGLSRADLEALVPVIEGRMPLLVSARRTADILQALKLARDENIRIILHGAEEGWLVADQIAAARVPVVLNPIADLPASYETLGSRLENAARLHQAGVLLAFESNEGGAHRARELRYNAGNAVAHGLPYAAAIAAITANPARIFGVADQVGTLEPGKDADVVLWSGDPLEPLSQPQAVFVRGQQQPLTSRPLQLRDRYLNPARAYPSGE